MQTYTVRKGQHDYKPNNFWINRRYWRFRYKVKMGHDNVYDLGDEDQNDWNKGGGISNCIWSNHKMAAMWGFRWNIKMGFYELGGYFHRNNEILYPGRGFPSDKFVIANIDDTVIIDVLMRKRKMSVIIYDHMGEILEVYNVDKNKHRWLSREISAWFGGNEVAPRTLSFDMEIKRMRI